MNFNNYVKWIAVAAAVCIFGTIFIINGKEQGGNHIQEITMGKDSEPEYVSTENRKEDRAICVEICGCVNTPGVYEVAEGSRVYEVIRLAGGLSDDAAQKAVNQAAVVSDGQQIYIPSANEETLQPDTSSGNMPGGSPGNLININQAGKEELMSLPGIGEAKAELIISYRESNGSFGKIEDIMNVSGIKEAAFNKIKELICI